MKFSQGKKRRVAISIDMDWGYKRHLEVYSGCQRYAYEAGWDCSVNLGVDRLLEREGASCEFDGVLARATPELAKAAENAGIPVVNVWMNSKANGVPSVFPDCEKVGRMAAEHLLRRGFRQFGFLGYKRDIDSRWALDGFREVTKAEGDECSVFRFFRNVNTYGWDRFLSDLETWVESWTPPIGILVAHDLYCRYLIDVCRSKGLHVSQDVAIVGVSNEVAICGSPSPTLTSIDLGYEEVGYRAAELLDGLMSGEPTPEKPILLSNLELIPRQSTDSYAADDPMVARALKFIAENSHKRMQVKDVVAAISTNRRSLER